MKTQRLEDLINRHLDTLYALQNIGSDLDGFPSAHADIAIDEAKWMLVALNAYKIQLKEEKTKLTKAMHESLWGKL